MEILLMVMAECSKQQWGPNKAWLWSSDWETVRRKVLQSRICDLRIRIKDSPLEPFIRQLEKELSAKGIHYLPSFYLTDSWGCPDQVPIIGIPFYLSSTVLWRIEKEETGCLEDSRTIMQFLRHETGHAINYAFRLWEKPGWKDTFGSFSRPYREVFYPNPWSRSFVRHINSYSYGYTYAQKHPDDDFAETFAVWLTPRSGWRRKYRYWPAIRKLRYLDRLMRQIRTQEPKRKGGKLVMPLSKLTICVADYYRSRIKTYARTS